MSPRTEHVVAKLAAVAWLALAGCGSEPPPPREPAPEAPPAATAPAAVEPPDPTPAELPLADDIAAEARQAIAADGYRAELDAIEKELAAEGVPSAP